MPSATTTSVWKRPQGNRSSRAGTSVATTAGAGALSCRLSRAAMDMAIRNAATGKEVPTGVPLANDRLTAPFAPILVDEGRVARAGGAEAAAAGRPHEQSLAGPHELCALALHPCPALDGNRAGRAIAAAVAPARRKIDAVESRQ